VERKGTVGEKEKFRVFCTLGKKGSGDTKGKKIITRGERDIV
jgi:hypothetical protein